MVGRDQYGYIKGPYYIVKPGPMPPGEHDKVECKTLHKLGGFPKLHAAGAAQKPFSQAPQSTDTFRFGCLVKQFAARHADTRVPGRGFHLLLGALRRFYTNLIIPPLQLGMQRPAEH